MVLGVYGAGGKKTYFFENKSVFTTYACLKCFSLGGNLYFRGGIMEFSNGQKEYSRTIDQVASSHKTTPDTRETAQYIADMVLELRNMAKSTEMKNLQGLLEVSFYEAFSVANKVPIPEGEIEHLRELNRASNG
jgi:hypothetical protein